MKPDDLHRPTETISFVHISDTHIGPSRDYCRHGFASLPCAQRVVEIINNLPATPAFVIHTGDVVTEPAPAAYQLAAEAFSALQVPIYFATGNHDTARDIRRFLPMGPHRALGDDPDRLFYRFVVSGYDFVVLDARAPDELDPHGLMPAAQIAYLRQAATEPGPPLVVFLHFPVLPMNSVWMDAYMRVINWEDVHRAFAAGSRRLRAVFFGHIHQPMQMVRDNVLYVSVASTFAQFGAWPNDVTTSFDPDHPPGFAFVQLLPEQTIVRQHTFRRP